MRGDVCYLCAALMATPLPRARALLGGCKGHAGIYYLEVQLDK
jgi:hypothetical protein